MLEELNIKDFALIENDYLEFDKGFTVLSGETGAGKSILIGALSFLLGGKAVVTQIRTGKNEASVSGTFVLPQGQKVRELSEDDEPSNAAEWLELHGIQIENNRVLLRRFIRDSGKSGAWINDTPVTRGDLASFSELQSCFLTKGSAKIIWQGQSLGLLLYYSHKAQRSTVFSLSLPRRSSLLPSNGLFKVTNVYPLA